jgi:hypothetical protein
VDVVRILKRFQLVSIFKDGLDCRATCYAYWSTAGVSEGTNKDGQKGIKVEDKKRKKNLKREKKNRFCLACLIFIPRNWGFQTKWG